MPLFTDDALNAFLVANSGNDLSTLTQSILADGFGAGPFDMSDGFNAGDSDTWPSGLVFGETAAAGSGNERGGVYKTNTDGVTAYYTPPVVSTYRECYDNMINNDDFSTAQSDDGISSDEDWENFTDEDGWSFLEELEREYNCAGICYTPLWYMTKNIKEGPPTQECLSPLFDDVFTTSKNLANGCAAALIVSVLCQLGLCGGMPANAGDEEESNTVEYNEQPSGYGTSNGMMKPGMK